MEFAFCAGAKKKLKDQTTMDDADRCRDPGFRRCRGPKQRHEEMQINTQPPTLASDVARMRHGTDPSLEGAMLQAMKQGEKVQSPAAVELIAATAMTSQYESRGDAGSLVDTYA